MLIVNFHPGMKFLHIYFLSGGEISSLSFSQEWVHPRMKFHAAENV